MVEAYVRGSTDQEDGGKQRYGVLASAHTRGLSPLQCLAETTSGQLA